MANILLSLIQNLFLLITLTFAFSYLLSFIKRLRKWQQQLFVGSIFGLFALISMATPSEILPGVFLDIRAPMLLVATILTGARGGAVAVLIILLYRGFIGGAGVNPSIFSAFAVYLMGYLVYRKYQGKIPNSAFLRLGVGFLSAAQVLVWPWIFFPIEAAMNFVQNSALPLIILYPFATYLLLDLLEREYYRDNLLLQLRESETRFKAVFNQSFQFLGLLNPEGILLESNETSLQFIGQSRDMIRNKPFWELDAWKSRPETPRLIQTAIERAARGEFVRFNVEMLDKQQQSVMIDFSIKPILDEQGQVSLLIPEGRDISPEILAERQRAELNTQEERMRIMQAFIQDASHNLRTPITVLRTSLYLFRRKIEGLVGIHQALKDIFKRMDKQAFELEMEALEKALQQVNLQPPKMQRSIDDLHSTVEGMLSLLRLDEEKAVLLVNEDIVAISQKTLEDYRMLSQDKSQNLCIDFPAEPIKLPLDESLWKRVVQNLLENAIFYTPNGGRIDLRLRRLENELVFEVQDSGIGIAESDKERVFERFFRADNARIVQNVGTGLGLAIVKRIVELHKGRIEIESRLNEGTTIRVYLPLQHS